MPTRAASSKQLPASAKKPMGEPQAPQWVFSYLHTSYLHWLFCQQPQQENILLCIFIPTQSSGYGKTDIHWIQQTLLPCPHSTLPAPTSGRTTAGRSHLHLAAARPPPTGAVPNVWVVMAQHQDPLLSWCHNLALQHVYNTQHQYREDSALVPNTTTYKVFTRSYIQGTYKRGIHTKGALCFTERPPNQHKAQLQIIWMCFHWA